jgi:hypothetical protein
MPRKRRRPKARAVALDDAAVFQLLTSRCPDNPWREFFVEANELRQEWQVGRLDLLEYWIAERPGTRPWAWWRFDAPRCRREDLPPRCQCFGEWLFERLEMPRRRIGGVGTPACEVLNVSPAFRRGIPLHWVTTSDESYYNGRSRDVHGQRIGTEYTDGQFLGVAPAAANPPMFESEAAYLQRHGLVTPTETRVLQPEQFEPVSYDEIFRPFIEGEDAEPVVDDEDEDEDEDIDVERRR